MKRSPLGPIWLFVCFLCAAVIHDVQVSFAADPSKEYIERLNAEARELTRRMEACTDMECINEISPRVQAISNELMRAHGYGDLLDKAGASGKSCDPYLPLPGSFDQCAAVTLTLSQASRWRLTDRLPTGDPGSRESFVSDDITVKYSAKGNGYLAYDEDLQEFFLYVEGEADDVDVTYIDGIWRSADFYGNIETRRFNGRPGVRNPPVLQIHYPPPSGPDMGTNISLRPAVVETTDPFLPSHRGSDIRTWAFDTGQRLDFGPDVLRKALEKGSYRRALEWERVRSGQDETSEYSIVLALQFDKPPEPGKLTVDPASAYLAERTKPDEPFKPSSKTYSVSNTGGESISVGIRAADSWLKLSTDGGELNPGASMIVTLQPDPGAQALREGRSTAVVRFINLSNAAGDTVRKVTVETAPERRIYDVTLTGERVQEDRLLYGLVDPGTGANETVQYQHGVTFRYDLGVRVVLEKHEGAWQYRSGKVTRSEVRYVYRQSPELYEVLSRSCSRCAEVQALSGRPIGGSSDGKTLRLLWPDVRPSVSMHTRLVRDCAPGPRRAQCESDKKSGTRFAGTDDDFFVKATGHQIDLSSKRTPLYDENRTGATLYTIRHTYAVTRVK